MEKKRSVFGRLAALALAAVLLCSLVLSGCGSQPTGDETQTSDQPQQTAEGVNVNYGLSNPWDSLMPYYSVSGSNYSRIIYDKIYDRLAYVQPDGTCLPRAAEKWEKIAEIVIPDGAEETNVLTIDKDLSGQPFALLKAPPVRSWARRPCPA